MILRVLAAAAVLAIAPAAKAAQAAEPAPLFSLEAAGALFFRADPQGSLYDGELAYGARLGFAPGGLPAPLLLDVALLWYGSGQTEGTDAVQVHRGLHTFALPLRAGWELGWRPFDALRLAPYLTGGAAATRTDVTYRIADPVARRLGLPIEEQRAGDWKAGGVYGAGLSIAGPAARISLVGRLELLRLHRGPSTDLALGLGVGAAF